MLSPNELTDREIAQLYAKDKREREKDPEAYARKALKILRSPLVDRGREASQLKSQARLEQLDQEPELPQTGHYERFREGSPYGLRYSVRYKDGGWIMGEFISSSAPPVNTEVSISCSPSGNLFDCL